MPPAALAALPMWAKIAIEVAAVVASSFLMPKPRMQRATRGRLSTEPDAVAPRRVIYGRPRVGGTIFYKANTGEGGKYRHLFIALAGHECEAIENIYVNDIIVSLDQSGYVTGGTQWDGLIKINKHLGAEDQVADADAVSALGQWTTDHRARGVCYVYIRLEYDEAAFPKGEPNFTFQVKGKKIFDPRTQTVAWSNNAALCLADYLAFHPGVGCESNSTLGSDYERIDKNTLISAANICDELVVLKAGGSEKRYLCDGYYDLDADPIDVLTGIASGIGQMPVFASGTWYVKAGAWRSPVKELTDRDFVGPLDFRPRLTRRDLANEVRGVHPSQDKRFQVSDYPVVRDTAAQTIDGGILTRQLDLPFTASPAAAQRLAKIELMRTRSQGTLSATCTLTAYDVIPGDTVTITHPRWGWSSKQFEVVTMEVVSSQDSRSKSGATIAIRMTFRETSSSVYSWTPATDENSGLSGDPDTLDPGAVPTGPTSFNIASGTMNAQITPDGLYVPRIRATWVNPTDPNAHYIELQIDNGNAGANWHDWKLIDLSATDPPTSAYYGPVASGNTYTARIRSKTRYGVASSWTTDTVLATANEGDYTGKIRGRRTTHYPRMIESAYVDSFDEFTWWTTGDSGTATGWKYEVGTGTTTFQANVGESGNGAVQIAGYNMYSWVNNIVFDPTKLYRFRIKARMTVKGSTPTMSGVVFGFQGVAQDGATLVNASGANSNVQQHFACYANCDGWTLNEWRTLTGWYRGHGASATATAYPDARAPGAAYSTVRYIRPFFAASFNGGTGYTVQIDSVAIDMFDEQAADRVYRSLAAGRVLYDGTVIRRASGDSGIPSIGLLEGAAVDGETVVFSKPFSKPPVVTFYPACKVYDSTTLSGSQYLDVRSVNLTAAGFTMYAKLADEQTTSSQTLSGTKTGTEWLSNAKTVSTEAYDDTYWFQVDVTVGAATIVYGETFPGVLTLAFWTSADGSTGWTKRAERTWDNEGINSKAFANQRVSVVCDGLGSAAKFKVTTTASTTGSSYTVDQVDYQTVSGGTSVTATPAGKNAKVYWRAVEGT